MIIDVHNHVGKDKDGLSQSLEELLVNMRQHGIDYAVAFPFDQDSDLVEASMDLLGKSDKIIPFLRIDPKIMEADRLDKLVDRFKGVKLHPRAQAFAPIDSRYFPLYEILEKKRKVLLIHSRKYNYNKDSDPDTIATLADQFPKLTIILGHFASFSPVAIDYVKKHENLYIETSTVQTHRLIGLACKRIGSEKIMFGSDSPYSDNEIELLKVKKAPISSEEKENILSNNIKRVLGI